MDVGGITAFDVPPSLPPPLLHSLATSVVRNKPKALVEYVVVTNNIFSALSH